MKMKIPTKKVNCRYCGARFYIVNNICPKCKLPHGYNIAPTTLGEYITTEFGKDSTDVKI